MKDHAQPVADRRQKLILSPTAQVRQQLKEGRSHALSAADVLAIGTRMVVARDTAVTPHLSEMGDRHRTDLQMAGSGKLRFSTPVYFQRGR
jgi:hypothetical protein